MDSYVDSAVRMLEHCVNAPRRALIGNWVHALPDEAYPGPNVDWLHELVRFFDHWLKGIDNGVMDEPALTLLRARVRAARGRSPTTWPGQLAERGGPAHWPAPAMRHPVAGGRRPGSRHTNQPVPVRRCSAIARRSALGPSLSWGAGWPPNGLARDLRPDEALLPTWTSPPLAEPSTSSDARLRSSRSAATMPVATAVVRLSDVAPDGTVAQVTAGILNLTHRHGHARPEPLVAGPASTRSPWTLRATGYRFAARPPDPAVGRLGLLAGDLALALRRRAARSISAARAWSCRRSRPPPACPRPRSGPTRRACPRPVPAAAEDPPIWRISEDVLAGTVTVTTGSGDTTALPDGSLGLLLGAARDDRLRRRPGPRHDADRGRLPARPGRPGDRGPGPWPDDLHRDDLRAVGRSRGQPRWARLPSRTMGRDRFHGGWSDVPLRARRRADLERRGHASPNR